MLRSSSLVERGAIPQVDDKLLILLRRLGLDALPPHETLVLPLERLVVQGADLLRPSPKLVRSIKHVGVLQSPAVVLRSGASLADPAATFEVIFGRRRVLAAQLAGLPVVKCEVYASGTPQLASLLALIENEQRSAAWIKEVQDLHRLIDEGVGMTLDDLVEFGFDRGSLAERLKMAQLPAPLLAVICAGKIPLAVAKRLVRLSPSQQQRVARCAVQGEQITADLVTETLRCQINAGLVPLQSALSLSLSEGGQAAGEPLPLAVPVPPGEEALLSGANGASFSLPSLLSTLRAFEQALVPTPSTQTLRLLTRSLIQELDVAVRTATPIVKERDSKGASSHG